MKTQTESRGRELFEKDRILELGLLAHSKKPGGPVGFLADDQAQRLFGNSADELSGSGWLHFLPSENTEALLAQVRSDFWVHGLSPNHLGGLELEQWKERGLSSFSLATGSLEQPVEGWEQLAAVDMPMVASFVYGPQPDYEALEQRLQALSRFPSVRSVLAIPLSAGDRILIPGATTDGTDDMKVLSLVRLIMPDRRVRVSWGTLGWKVAQVGLAFGADELCGWGVEEQIVFGERVRAASQVNKEEVQLGLEEAGYRGTEMKRCDWES